MVIINKPNLATQVVDLCDYYGIRTKPVDSAFNPEFNTIKNIYSNQRKKLFIITDEEKQYSNDIIKYDLINNNTDTINQIVDLILYYDLTMMYDVKKEEHKEVFNQSFRPYIEKDLNYFYDQLYSIIDNLNNTTKRFSTYNNTISIIVTSYNKYFPNGSVITQLDYTLHFYHGYSHGSLKKVTHKFPNLSSNKQGKLLKDLINDSKVKLLELQLPFYNKEDVRVLTSLYESIIEEAKYHLNKENKNV